MKPGRPKSKQGRKKSSGKPSVDDVVRRKAKSQMATLNPFEFKLTREKHNVLNRREKHGRGTPGVSRSKALHKRKQTLLEEYRQRNKANEFVDKRLGECDADMTLEDKMIARFSAEAKRQHDKGDIYNLNDEELTHLGQSLAEIEKFDDPRSEDEEDEAGGDKLGARFVKAAHFGGFLTKKEQGGGSGEQAKSRQEMIDEMIANSKLRKHERQSEREATEDMTDKVDAEWKEVRCLLSEFHRSASSAEEETKKTVEEYDVVVRQLKFDLRATPTDRLKTPEELAKDEKEKLEKQEADRLRRMTGLREEEATKNVPNGHKSADDLDDGLITKKDEKRFHLSYKDGKVEDSESKTCLTPQKKKVTFEEDVRSSKKNSTNNQKEEEDEEEQDEEDDEQLSSEESDDSYADILSGESEEEDEEDEDKVSKIKTDLKERKTVMDSARKELPYTFDVPGTYEEFIDLIKDHSTCDQLVILERMLKCNHPCFSDDNLPRLNELFTFLLQWLDDMPATSKEEESLLDTIDGLVPILFDLVQFSPMNAARALLDVVLKKQEQFQHQCKRSNTRAPELNTVIFLKLVPILFPASDYSHLVVTPTFLFMSQILTQSTISGGHDIAVCLFVCNLFLECVSLSKRFVPEVMNFLRGCFVSALTRKKTDGELEPFVHPFRPDSDALCVLSDCSQMKCAPLSLRCLQRDDVITDNFRISAINICITLLRRFAELYADVASFPITFNPILEHHCLLPVDRLPVQVKQELNGLIDFLKRRASTFELATMVRERRKPKPTKLFEPLIEDQFDGRRRRSGDAATLEKQRLEHRYKREMKGAVREIRRDNRFLAQQRFSEQRERDGERKRKLKEIYHDLASQEGFCKNIERKKKYLK